MRTKRYDNIDFQELEWMMRSQHRRIKTLSTSKHPSVSEVAGQLCHHPSGRPCNHPSCVLCRHPVQQKVKDTGWDKFQNLPFELVPECNMHWLTVNLCEVPFGVSDDDFRAIVKKYRDDLRNIFRKECPPNTMATGAFEIARLPKHNRWRLHTHLIVYSGWWASIENVRSVFKKHYPGANQVRFDSMDRTKPIEKNVRNCLGYAVKGSWLGIEKDNALFEEYVRLTESIRSGRTRGWQFSYGLSKRERILGEYQRELTEQYWKPVMGRKKAHDHWWTSKHWRERIMKGLRKLGIALSNDSDMGKLSYVEGYFDEADRLCTKKSIKNGNTINNSGMAKPAIIKKNSVAPSRFSNENSRPKNKEMFERIRSRLLMEDSRKKPPSKPPPDPKDGWFF